MATQQTIAIIPGFGEGPWHVRRLGAALENVGFQMVDNAANAEIVVSHSAGCYFLPNTRTNQVIILIGPPFWPGRSVFANFVRKETHDLLTRIKHRQLRFWVTKVVIDTIYIGRDILRAGFIAKHARKHKFYEALAEKKAIVIRNEYDAFCTPNIQKILSDKAKFTYHQIPGEHDDCWFYTREHAELIHSIVISSDSIAS